MGDFHFIPLFSELSLMKMSIFIKRKSFHVHRKFLNNEYTLRQTVKISSK